MASVFVLWFRSECLVWFLHFTMYFLRNHVRNSTFLFTKVLISSSTFFLHDVKNGKTQFEYGKCMYLVFFVYTSVKNELFSTMKFRKEMLICNLFIHERNYG